MDILQHQDESLPAEQHGVTMIRELISFGRAMNCRSFSTTPPSPLFRAAADFSPHCIHMSHSGHIRRVGAAVKFLLPWDPKLPCCSLNEKHSYFVCPQKQNNYDHFSPIFPCFPMSSHTTSHSLHPLSIAALLQIYWGSRIMSAP